MNATARGVALQALVRGGDITQRLDGELQAAALAGRDRAFATELAYGTVKMRRALAWSVERCSTRPFAAIQPDLRWALLLGAYQLLYLDRVPAHSAVDESVSLARTRMGKAAAGFANAVLRKIAASRPLPPPPDARAGAPSLGLAASLPDWIAAHFIDRFGFEAAVRIAVGLNGPPRRALRVDLARTSVASVEEEVAEHGGSARTGSFGIPECVVVEGESGRQAARGVVRDGKAAWQSEESQLAVHILDPRPGEIVIDACAGRGVKTMMIARRLAGSGRIWSLEDDARKLVALGNAATAAGLEIVHGLRANLRHGIPEPVPERVDAALVDAPCSGLGIIGRRPDARWQKRATDPSRFAPLQADILTNVAQRVRPGGRLAYVTCSTHPVENDAVVDAFLAKHRSWRTEAIAVAQSDAVRALGASIQTLPGIDGADGFFYALLRAGESAII